LSTEEDRQSFYNEHLLPLFTKSNYKAFNEEALTGLEYSRVKIVDLGDYDDNKILVSKYFGAYSVCTNEKNATAQCNTLE
jgi:hypothetical protein